MVVGSNEVMVAVIITMGFICLSYAFGDDQTVKINSIYAGIVLTSAVASGNAYNTFNCSL